MRDEIGNFKALTQYQRSELRLVYNANIKYVDHLNSILNMRVHSNLNWGIALSNVECNTVMAGVRPHTKRLKSNNRRT